MSKLSDICEYVREKVDVLGLTNENYISTENMLPEKGGVIPAASLPTTDKVQKYSKGDVLVSNIRPYFKKIWQARNNGGCSNDVLVFKAKDNCYSVFLYYVLANDDFFKYATATSKGTKMPRGDKSSIMQYEVPCLDLETQKKIARVLGALDDKIELNNQINHNLEEQARALFKSWFIDFEPFGGKMPEDWKWGTIRELSKEIICGKTPSTKNKEYFGCDIPFITIPDMHTNTYITQTERYLSEEGAASQITKMLSKNSICVSCIGTAGLVSLVADKSQTNQQINSIIPKHDVSPFYVYFAMKLLRETINKLGQSGSTIVNLNKTQFEKIQVIIPQDKKMKEFNDAVVFYFDSILVNQKENINLIQLRDMLLSKFLCGEVDVTQIKI